MAKKKKKKKVKAFDALAGYVATSAPTQPIIKEQFGVPTSLTNPSNVPVIQQFVTQKVTPILGAYVESFTGSTDSIVYTLTPGKTLMLTGYILSTTGIGAITENNEAFLYVCVPGGDSSSGSSKIIGFVPGCSVAGVSNIVQMNFPTPIALDGDIWSTIVLFQEDTDTHDRAQIFGYLIENS